MLKILKPLVRNLLIRPSCPLCRKSVDQDTLKRPCQDCQDRLLISPEGLKGSMPMSWHALGLYQGKLRALLLQERSQPCEKRFEGLIHLLRDGLRLMESELLCPIPSWRTRRVNCLPNRIAMALGHPSRPLLQRRKAGLSQHHLNRSMRLSNLHEAFETVDVRRPQGISGLWIVDDILTTGSTALSARATLLKAGYEVRGLICLARTPHTSQRIVRTL